MQRKGLRKSPGLPHVRANNSSCISLFPALEHWWMNIPPFLFLVHVMLLFKANYTDDVTLGHSWFPYLCSFQSNRPWSKMYMRIILFFLLNKINDTPPLFWFRHWSSLAVMLLVAIGSLINFISSCAAEPLLLCAQEDVCAGRVSLLSSRDPVKLCFVQAYSRSKDNIL